MEISIARKAFKQGSWLALFRGISQLFSWGATIAIARILVPEDYGFMEMATILTGYVALFSELGLGIAVIQREHVNREELSSLFWFTICWGFILAIACIFLAYPTAIIFDEKRILRVTQSVSILFIIESLLIVPLNLLHRELKFKALGIIDATSVIISCSMMILIARLGGGVWTLIGGHIIREFLRLVFVFAYFPWRPTFHYNFSETKAYLKFGLNVAGARSLHYVYSKSDRFFGGRALGAHLLGYYSLALQLATIPNDKLISLINSVSFPVFSRYQRDKAHFNEFYLKLVNMIGFITFPLYIGGIFIADQLIPFLLGTKWTPLILPFKLLCAAQLFACITTPTGLANNALGRPHWELYFTLTSVLILPLSFCVAARYGLIALAIPWVTVFPLLRITYACVTLRKLEISIKEFIRSLIHPILGTISMLCLLIFLKQIYLIFTPGLLFHIRYYIFLAIILGITIYAIYTVIFQRSIFTLLLSLRNR